ncbi:MAG: Hsp20/alpha crystallin family protein [Myxococcota bacterium]
MTKTSDPTRNERTFIPLVDITETDNAVTIEADMPGVGQDGVRVILENDTLSLWGEVSRDERSGYSLVGREYEVGNYHRTFFVSQAIDREAIEASMKDGVLHVTLMKAKQAGAKRITVKAA